MMAAGKGWNVDFPHCIFGRMEQFTVFIICLGLVAFFTGELLFRRRRRK
jgi:hypothetical protein